MVEDEIIAVEMVELRMRDERKIDIPFSRQCFFQTAEHGIRRSRVRHHGHAARKNHEFTIALADIQKICVRCGIGRLDANIEPAENIKRENATMTTAKKMFGL